MYASFLGLADLTIPTVAAVNGPAIGAGVNIALACDVVPYLETWAQAASFGRSRFQSYLHDFQHRSQRGNIADS